MKSNPAIAYAVDSYKQADILNVNRLKNQAIPAGFLKSEQKLQEDERKKQAMAFKEAYVAGVLTERDYTVVRAWLRASVDAMVIPRQRMQKLQERAGSVVTAMRA